MPPHNSDTWLTSLTRLLWSRVSATFQKDTGEKFAANDSGFSNCDGFEQFTEKLQSSCESEQSDLQSQSQEDVASVDPDTASPEMPLDAGDITIYVYRCRTDPGKMFFGVHSDVEMSDLERRVLKKETNDVAITVLHECRNSLLSEERGATVELVAGIRNLLKTGSEKQILGGLAGGHEASKIWASGEDRVVRAWDRHKSTGTTASCFVRFNN